MKNFRATPCMFVNLLTPDQLALFSLLQRERFNVRIIEFEIERHRVALDRSGVSRGTIVRSLISAGRPAALHAMRAAEVEIPICIEDQRSFDDASRTVVFDRR